MGLSALQLSGDGRSTSYSGNGSIMGKRRPRSSPQSHCAHREAFEIGKRAVRKIGENEIFRRDDDPAYGGAGQVDRLLPASGSVRKLNKRALRSSDYPSPDDGLRNPLGTIQLANRREVAMWGLLATLPLDWPSFFSNDLCRRPG